MSVALNLFLKPPTSHPLRSIQASYEQLSPLDAQSLLVITRKSSWTLYVLRLLEARKSLLQRICFRMLWKWPNIGHASPGIKKHYIHILSFVRADFKRFLGKTTFLERSLIGRQKSSIFILCDCVLVLIKSVMLCSEVHNLDPSKLSSSGKLRRP